MTAKPLRPTTDESLWQRRYLDLSDFVSRNGRLPNPQHRGSAERRLYRWVEVQREQAVAGTLPPARAQQLTALIPDASNTRPSTPPWATRYDDLAAFLIDKGRMPSSAQSQDPGEDRLARWWHRQLSATGADALSPEQRRLLDVLPINYAPQIITPP